MNSDHLNSLPEQYSLRFKNVARLYQRNQIQVVLQRLYESSVCVVGLGGVGSWVVEALARSGVGRLTLIDLDDICVSNINRQVMAQSSTVGQFKSDALKDRVLEINPDANVTTILDFITSENVEKYLINKIIMDDNSDTSESVRHRVLFEPKFDYVVDAADRVTDKAAIIHACVQSQTPVISSGGVGGLIDPTSIRINDLVDVKGDSLLMRVRRKLREAYDYPKLNNKTKLHPRKWYIRTVHSVGTAESSLFSSQTSSDSPATLECAAVADKRGGFRSCDTTFGNACFATGTLGFVIASEVINRIALSQMIYPKVPQRNSFMKTAKIKVNHLSEGREDTNKKSSENSKKSIPNNSGDRNENSDNHPFDCSCGKEYCQSSSSSSSPSRTLYEVLQQQPGFISITNPLFDAHCHLQLPPIYDIVHDEIAVCLRENITQLSVCGTCPTEDWIRINHLAADYPTSIYPNYGLHPWWIEKYEATEGEDSTSWIDQLRLELERNPLAGVGECGLDKNLKKQVSLEKQISYLVPHIRLACQYQRPLTLHCVSGGWGNLHQTLLKTLKEEKEFQPSNQIKSIILHSCQSLPVDMLPMFHDLSKRYISNNLFYSFSGNSLLVPDERKASTSSYQKTIKLLTSLPKENILIESDSPDQLPIFAREQQVLHNTPLIIKLACVELAKLFKTTTEEMAILTSCNARRAFGLFEENPTMTETKCK
eukprot:gene15773-17716_t